METRTDGEWWTRLDAILAEEIDAMDCDWWLDQEGAWGIFIEGGCLCHGDDRTPLDLDSEAAFREQCRRYVAACTPDDEDAGEVTQCALCDEETRDLALVEAETNREYPDGVLETVPVCPRCRGEKKEGANG